MLRHQRYQRQFRLRTIVRLALFINVGSAVVGMWSRQIRSLDGRRTAGTVRLSFMEAVAISSGPLLDLATACLKTE